MLSSIEQVIEKLKQLVLQCEKEENPLGYFAALYLDVTQLVANAIQSGKVFEHSADVEQLDLHFAQRYFDAIDSYYNGTRATMPWEASFVATKLPGIVVDQHFLSAANAHISFDLAIAVGDTFRGRDLSFFRKDFDALNELLFSMNNAVNGMIKKIWPPVSVILRIFGSPMLRMEDLMMKRSRDKAWQLATQLASGSNEQRAQVMQAMETQSWETGMAIVRPPWWMRGMFGDIAKAERGDVASRIRIMVQKQQAT